MAQQHMSGPVAADRHLRQSTNVNLIIQGSAGCNYQCRPRLPQPVHGTTLARHSRCDNGLFNFTDTTPWQLRGFIASLRRPECTTQTIDLRVACCNHMKKAKSHKLVFHRNIPKLAVE